METLKDRLVLFISAQGLDKATFERMCDLSNGFVDKAGNNTRQSSIDKISKIFPELNIAWLRTGLGDIRAGKEDPDLNSEIAKAIKELAEEGKPIGGSVIPYEFVQALLDERKRHDEKEMELLNQNRQLMELLNSRLDGFEKRIINASMENARDAAVNE